MWDRCTKCGKQTLSVMTCELDDGQFCDACFDEHPCLEEHEPGCACRMIEGRRQPELN